MARKKGYYDLCYFSIKTNCQYGRESFDSWGRRKREAREKREIGDDGEGQELGETQMRLSHEIIVLDYGDEQTSPFDNIDNHFTSQRRDRNDNGKQWEMKWQCDC